VAEPLEPPDAPRTAPEDSRPTPPDPEPDALPSSTGAVLLRLADELSVRVDLGGWERTAARLLDELDAAVRDPLDPESPWVRIGYWVVTTAAVGVAVELGRLGLRARRLGTDPAGTPMLPVRR
jgi:hypothetical protein